jgi:hypothetical protein
MTDMDAIDFYYRDLAEGNLRTPLGKGVDPKVTVVNDDGHVTVNLSGLSRNVYSEKIKDPRNRVGNPYPD